MHILPLTSSIRVCIWAMGFYVRSVYAGNNVILLDYSIQENFCVQNFKFIKLGVVVCPAMRTVSQQNDVHNGDDTVCALCMQTRTAS